MENKRRVRIFLSSPGDVDAERVIATTIIEQLAQDCADQADIEMVAWDRPGGSVPMLANMPPQEAINLGLPRPSECEIVVVIMWSRMGTPLPDEYRKTDGTTYLSGTEWEYEDAIQVAEKSGSPLVVVYRRDDPPAIRLDDPSRDEKIVQWERVKNFFDTFRMPDGTIGKGYNQYQTIDQFGPMLIGHLRDLINRVVDVAPVLTFVTNSIENQEFLFSAKPWPFKTDLRGEDIKSKHTVRSKRQGIVPNRQFNTAYPTLAADQIIIRAHLKNTSEYSVYVRGIHLSVEGIFPVTDTMFWNTWKPMLTPPMFTITVDANKSLVEANMDGQLIEVLPMSTEPLSVRIWGDVSCPQKIIRFSLAIVYHDSVGQVIEVPSDRIYHIAFSDNCIRASDNPFTGKTL